MATNGINACQRMLPSRAKLCIFHFGHTRITITFCFIFVDCVHFYYIMREAQPRRNVYWPRLSVCLSLAASACPHYCTDLDVTWGNGRGASSSCALLGDLQSVHRFHCYDNTAPNAKCQQVLVLALSLVLVFVVDENAEYFLSFSLTKYTVHAWHRMRRW